MFIPRYSERLQLNHPEAEIPGDTLYLFDDDVDREQLSDQVFEYMLLLADNLVHCCGKISKTADLAKSTDLDVPDTSI